MGFPVIIIGIIGIAASIGGFLHHKHQQKLMSQYKNDDRLQQQQQQQHQQYENNWQPLDGGRGKFVLTVNNNQYNIDYDIRATPRELAFEFCTHSGQKLGYNVETLKDCVTPIEKEIILILRNSNAFKQQQQQQQQQQQMEQQQFQEEEIPEGMQKIKLIFNDKDFDILYGLGTAPKEIALEFCSRMGSNLGFTMETISDCIKPIELEITKQFGETNNVNKDDNNNNKVKDIGELTLEINGVNYVFEYPTNLDKIITAKSLAEEFCNRKAFDLNIQGLAIDNDNEYNRQLIKASCYDPLVDAILNELEKYEVNKNEIELLEENDILI